MDMQTNGPVRGWTWLMRGLNIGFEHPGVLFGAGALVLAYGVAVLVLQMAMQSMLHVSPQGQLVFTGVMMVVGAVVYPLLCAGFLRLMHALEHGRPVRALNLLDAFRTGAGAGRLVILGLCLTMIYVLFLVLLYCTVGHDLGAWYMQVLTLSAHPQTHPVMPPLPGGFGATIALAMVFFMFYSAAFAIAMGQAALRAKTPLQALRDGVIGAFKNVLPLLVLALVGMVGWIVFAIAFGIVAVIVALVAGLISKVLSLVLLGALYLGLMLLVYVVMFGVMYAIWRDVTGAEEPDAASRTPSISVEA